MVLEIGAGPGNMTELLGSRAGAVESVELDRTLASELRRKFEGDAHIRICEADILDLSIDQIARAAGREKIKVFGNLPYYITSPCLMHLFRYYTWISEIVVMVQEEVALRLVAKPSTPDYGLLSLTCQYYTQPELLFSVAPGSFSPPPQVRSALVRMVVSPLNERLGIGDTDKAFWKAIRAAFSQKRKTLFNNWKQMWDEKHLRRAMEAIGIAPQARAETLTLDQFAALLHALRSQSEPRP